MDSDTPYWPSSLPAPLIGRRRRVDPQSITTAMDSSRLRIRRQHLASFKSLSVIWNFTADEYATFCSFFKETLAEGSLIFVLETEELGQFPGVPRTYTRELGFLNTDYKVTASDNLVSVEAELEIVSEVFEEWIGFYVLETPGGDHVPFEDADSRLVEVLYE